jgi:hypothetical protein
MPRQLPSQLAAKSSRPPMAFAGRLQHLPIPRQLPSIPMKACQQSFGIRQQDMTPSGKEEHMFDAIQGFLT